MHKSGRDRDKGRKFESGHQKRKKNTALEECKQELRGSMKKFLKTGKITASEEVPEQEKMESVLTEKEDSQPSTSGQSEQDTILCTTEEEIITGKAQVLGSDQSESTYQPLSYDPGEWTFPVEEKDRVCYIQKGPIREEKVTFPLDSGKRHFSSFHYTRVLSNRETQDRRWLVYSRSNDCVFCFACRLFSSLRRALVSDGCSDWKNLSNRLSLHENSSDHLENIITWMEAEKRFRCGKTIDASLQKQIVLEKQRWREILERLIATVQFLASHNLPFRGHRESLEGENSGNFIDLVKLCARYDPVLREHLHRIEEKRVHNHYLGKNIQNELITLMAKLVKQKVIEKILQAKYYAIILDCTRDVSHVEQMTVILRHVDEQSGDIEEHFIGFIPVEKTTAEELTKNILMEIEESGLDIKNCRGQGYDNGANMRGEKSGVKTRILSINPLAFFTPCGCHSWNLVLGDAAASCAKAKLFFGLLQRLYTLFSGSSNRWAFLKEKVNITLKPLSETRWECRVESVKAVRYQLKEIAECLEEMAHKNTDPAFCSECNSLKEEILSYEFVLSLVVWYEILVKINLISKVWQKCNMQLDTAVKHLEEFLCWLTEYRQNGFNSAIVAASDIAEEMDIPREFRQRRIRRTKRMFDYECPDEAVVDPADRFRAEYFYIIVDKIQASAEPRFEGLKSYVNNFGFLYDISSLRMESEEDLLQNCKELEALLTLPNSSDSDIRGLELYEELRMCTRTVPTKLDMCGSLKYLIDNNLTDVYPNIYVALRVILTIPVTVASAERSFSKLKLIKTYLRSTMGQERLSALAVLSIERDLASKLSYSCVIDEFTNAKCRRMF